MLVFSNRQHGGPFLSGIAIPGYLDNCPPARVPYELFNQHRKELTIAPYTKEWFEKEYGREFPNISFCYHHIRHLSHSQLVALFQALRITSPKRKSKVRRMRVLRDYLRKHC